MVYTTLKIILGVAASEEEVLDGDNSEDRVLDIYDLGRLPRSREDVIISSIHSNHGEEEEEHYITGLEMHTYYRKHGIKCDKCKEYTLCDQCIGQTNNGCYDVRAMCSRPVEVDWRHMCLYCFSDNRKDLGAPNEVILPNGNYSLSHDMELQRCGTCGRKPDARFTPQDYFRRFDGRYESLRKVLSEYDNLKDKPIKFYYLLDDCLCCTWRTNNT